MYNGKTYIKPLPFTHTHAHTHWTTRILTKIECKNFIIKNLNICDGSLHLVQRYSEFLCIFLVSLLRKKGIC